ELYELLRNYPKWRSQCLHLQTVGRALVGLRGNMTDQLREINFCRVRLAELLQAFSPEQVTVRSSVLEELPPPPPPPPPGAVRCLLPAGCATLEQAGDHFARDATAEELRALDRQVQDMIVQQFRTLFNVCMTPANLLKNVQVAMEQEVARATEQRINATDV